MAPYTQHGAARRHESDVGKCTTNDKPQAMGPTWLAWATSAKQQTYVELRTFGLTMSYAYWVCAECGEPNQAEWNQCHNCDAMNLGYADV